MFVAVLLLAASGCASEPVVAPDTLVDGTPAAAATVALEGVESPTILTRVVVEDRIGPRQRSCLDEWAHEEPVRRSIVRMSVYGESVTLLGRSGRTLFACDNAPERRMDDRRWCGAAYGVLRHGRLVDPRLDLLCSTADRPLAFAWITPAPRARLVVVRQDGWAEVYPAVGGAPIRVASTKAVDPVAGSASFEVSEHAAGGALVRRYVLEARVAG
jgi:hypothetical protein